MKTTTKRQRNLRHRRDLETCIHYFIKEIKTNDPTEIPLLKKRLEELFKCIEEYILLNNNKGETYEDLCDLRHKS